MEFEYQFQPGFWNSFSSHPSLAFQAARHLEIQKSSEKKQERKLEEILKRKVPETIKGDASESFMNFLGDVAFGKFEKKAKLEVLFFESLIEGNEEVFLVFRPKFSKAFMELYYGHLATALRNFGLNERPFSLMNSYMNIYPTIDLKNTEAFKGLTWLHAKNKTAFLRAENVKIEETQEETLKRKMRAKEIILSMRN